MLNRTTFAAAILAAAACVHAETVEMKYEEVPLNVGTKVITADIANEETTIMFGLMNRTSMPADRGMLFVFENAGKYPFWMHNTLVDLDIIWMDANGKVQEIVTMKAHDEIEKGGNFNSIYVLEVNAGTAKALGLKVGDTIPIPKKIVNKPAKP